MSIQAATPTARTSVRFQHKHLLDFALKVTQRDLTTALVCSVRCQFCAYSGREQIPGQKRQRQQTMTVKHWVSPFRTELYKKHHESQHFTQWREYQVLSHDEKVAHFTGKLQFKETLHSHFGQKNTHLLFKFDASIVEIIIGDLFFHPDDYGGPSHVKALKLFKQNTENSDYMATIKNSMQFHLVVDYVGAGLSFRQVANVINATKKRTNLSAIGSLSDTEVANYARVVCAINLQAISTILNNDMVWAFSLANDASTHFGKSYFDNQIHFHLNGVLYNVHAIAIPMFDRHTGENMFNLVSTFLDVVCSDWRAKLIGLSSDGATVMTGYLQGVVTRLEQQAEYKLYRTWCGLHQLDLVMQHGYAKLMNGELLTIMNAFIAHLRQQTNLIIDMKSTCPKLANRWVVIGNVCKWLWEKKVRLFQYLAENEPSQTPPDWWWVVIAAQGWLSEQTNRTEHFRGPVRFV